VVSDAEGRDALLRLAAARQPDRRPGHRTNPGPLESRAALVAAPWAGFRRPLRHRRDPAGRRIGRASGWSPSRIEFWQDQPFRLHDRLVFTRRPARGWTTERLYP